MREKGKARQTNIEYVHLASTFNNLYINFCIPSLSITTKNSLSLVAYFRMLTIHPLNVKNAGVPFSHQNEMF